MIKCNTCNDTRFVVRTFTGSVGLESSWRAKGSSNAPEHEKKPCPACKGIQTIVPESDVKVFESRATQDPGYVNL
jgi:hypothetical protein